jgi:uncharacterized membrane protein (UPF0127 family)
MKKIAEASGLREIWFMPEKGRPSNAIVRSVSAPEDLRRGLMFRMKLRANEGMLFDFGRRTVHSMWMRNTFVPLDMIFVDGDAKAGWKVVGVVKSAEPLSEEPKGIGEPSMYVIEVPGGFCEKRGIVPGVEVLGVA